MIYESTDVTAPIRQGDIFFGLPRIDLSLQEVLLVEDAGERVIKWEELAGNPEPVNILVPVRSVVAIVATQDCDALRSRDITLCEIRPFRDVDGKAKDANAPKSWVPILTQHARINQKWFYLPPDDSMSFSEKMAVDFLVTLRLPRQDLESLRSLRRGRLNNFADEHFRERIGEFFRRYPYDEWYSLNPEELDEYRKKYPDAQSFAWQQKKAGA